MRNWHHYQNLYGDHSHSSVFSFYCWENILRETGGLQAAKAGLELGSPQPVNGQFYGLQAVLAPESYCRTKEDAVIWALNSSTVCDKFALEKLRALPGLCLVKTPSPWVEEEKLYSQARMLLRSLGRESESKVCAWVRWGSFLLTHIIPDRVVIWKGPGHFNTWSPVGDVAWGGVGGMAMLEKCELSVVSATMTPACCCDSLPWWTLTPWKRKSK